MPKLAVISIICGRQSGVYDGATRSCRWQWSDAELRVIGGRYHYTAAGQLAQHEALLRCSLAVTCLAGAGAMMAVDAWGGWWLQ